MAGKEALVTTHDATRVKLKGGRKPTLVFNQPTTVICNDLIRFIFNSEESTRDPDTVDAAPPAR